MMAVKQLLTHPAYLWPS